MKIPAALEAKRDDDEIFQRSQRFRCVWIRFHSVAGLNKFSLFYRSTSPTLLASHNTS